MPAVLVVSFFLGSYFMLGLYGWVAWALAWWLVITAQLYVSGTFHRGSDR